MFHINGNARMSKMNNYQDINNHFVQEKRAKFSEKLSETAKIDTEYPARTANIMIGIFNTYRTSNKCYTVPISHFKQQFLIKESEIHVSPDVEKLKKEIERTMDKMYKSGYITYLDCTEEPSVSPQKPLEEMLNEIYELIK